MQIYSKITVHSLVKATSRLFLIQQRNLLLPMQTTCSYVDDNCHHNVSESVLIHFLNHSWHRKLWHSIYTQKRPILSNMSQSGAPHPKLWAAESSHAQNITPASATESVHPINYPKRMGRPVDSSYLRPSRVKHMLHFFPSSQCT